MREHVQGARPGGHPRTAGAAERRDERLARVRKLSLWITGGAAFATLGLGTAFAHALPGHSVSDSTATGTSSSGSPAAAGSGRAAPAPSATRSPSSHAPAPARPTSAPHHSSERLSAPASKPAPAPAQAPVVQSGGS
jgi:hypothetical protein